MELSVIVLPKSYPARLPLEKDQPTPPCHQQRHDHHDHHGHHYHHDHHDHYHPSQSDYGAPEKAQLPCLAAVTILITTL